MDNNKRVASEKGHQSITGLVRWANIFWPSLQTPQGQEINLGHTLTGIEDEISVGVCGFCKAERGDGGGGGHSNWDCWVDERPYER
ncbi:hypothetical protein B0O99DRAFT_682143 [Bisporella sp. PMI_857]|nr:hypothetical protein B0O99DRAFT_682143 [Bisporella sp. PMI_857]